LIYPIKGVALGVLVVVVFAFGPMVRGFKPSTGRYILKPENNP
jgi:hypothetical protein